MKGVDGGPSRAVLVTGCSSGIGRATALRLSAHGLPVYATARRLEAIEDLAAKGCQPLRLDVCDEASMRSAVETVEARHGAVGVLVNNAGYGLAGAVEELPLDEVRRQFETNLFGPLRLTQLVLPAMRRQRRGRIINVSSVGGRLTTPGNGAYHASKHALEALSDALRFELRGFGIAVIVVEPGAIATRWVETAVRGMTAHSAPAGPYAELDRRVGDRLRGAHEGLLRLAAGQPDDVARVIEQAVSSPAPRSRYVVPAVSGLFVAFRRAAPDRLWDWFMRRMYPSPGTGR
jgi:NAD(P)-dependent dehydrogenase (short-subunit alcohol dehydrogenase family)